MADQRTRFKIDDPATYQSFEEFLQNQFENFLLFLSQESSQLTFSFRNLTIDSADTFIPSIDVFPRFSVITVDVPDSVSFNANLKMPPYKSSHSKKGDVALILFPKNTNTSPKITIQDPDGNQLTTFDYSTDSNGFVWLVINDEVWKPA